MKVVKKKDLEVEVHVNEKFSWQNCIFTVRDEKNPRRGFTGKI